VRSAPIQRRDLGDFVRPIWLVVAALLNAAIVSVFVGGYLTGAITGELLMRRTVGIVIGLALAAGLLCYGLRRKPSRADEMLQGTYRLREVQLYVALFYLMAFVGLFRIGTDFLDIHLFTVLSYFVVNSVVVQALFFVLISASRGREQPAAVDLGADPHMAG
jgi:peptidoglycan biosynthesis protein MviN/MurJ (putative lipid II flippase)